MANTDEKPVFVERLGRLLVEMNFSRGALARELGVDKSVVSRWMHGSNQPSEHNLSRLTEVARRCWPAVTMDFWRPSSGNLPVLPPLPRLVLSGLNIATPLAVSRRHVGLWAGFNATVETPGKRLYVLVLREEPDGLRAEFNDGTYTADGAVIAVSGFLHLFFEVMDDNPALVCFILNGLGLSASPVMTGLINSAFAGIKHGPTVFSLPTVLLRIGTVDEYDRIGPEVMGRTILDLRQTAARNRIAYDDSVAAWEGVVEGALLRALEARVWTPNDDGTTDVVMRMPKNRWPFRSDSSTINSLPSAPVEGSIAMLRHRLGLD